MSENPRARSVDIGVAATQPMMDEYREVSEARKAGRVSHRLTAAAAICNLLLVVAFVALVVYALTTWR